jgi:ferric-dicitrate binding protein FerR (iron transport regulator)
MKRQKENIEKNIFLADWIAGKITDADFQEMVSEDDYLAYNKIREALNKIERPVFNTEASFSSLKEIITQKSKKPKAIVLYKNWIYTAVAAAFILFFGVNQFLKTDVKEITKQGQTKLVALNEGTTIHLNAQSTLSYPKYKSQREVTLDGEAFFEVTKKGDFIVSTSSGIIKVLGTQFNVISRNDFFEVICYEGKVKVIFQGQEKILTKDMAWRSIVGEQESWNNDIGKVGWLHGESNFISVPVSFIFDAIENQYGVEIDTNDIDETIRFTGSFSHSDIDNALKSICLPLSLGYQMKDTKIVLYKK